MHLFSKYLVKFECILFVDFNGICRDKCARSLVHVRIGNMPLLINPPCKTFVNIKTNKEIKSIKFLYQISESHQVTLTAGVTVAVVALFVIVCILVILYKKR